MADQGYQDGSIPAQIPQGEGVSGCQAQVVHLPP